MAAAGIISVDMAANMEPAGADAAPSALARRRQPQCWVGRRPLGRPAPGAGGRLLEPCHGLAAPPQLEGGARGARGAEGGVQRIRE